jgi:DNA invertase Pin-like site-specific DNA recombinase
MARPIALYARVSTSEQNPDAQLIRLRAYARDRGAVALEFTDKASGATRKRPALEALLEAARRREVSAVVVVKLDRVARSVAHLAELGEELRALEVALVVLDQAIDTATPSGRLLFNVLGSIAEFERDLIRERTRDGLEAARRRGSRLGRPPALDRQARERVARLRATGASVRKIAALLEVGVATVARELERLEASG